MCTPPQRVTALLTDVSVPRGAMFTLSSVYIRVIYIFIPPICENEELSWKSLLMSLFIEIDRRMAVLNLNAALSVVNEFLSQFTTNFHEILHTIFHSCRDYPESFDKYLRS